MNTTPSANCRFRSRMEDRAPRAYGAPAHSIFAHSIGVHDCSRTRKTTEEIRAANVRSVGSGSLSVLDETTVWYNVYFLTEELPLLPSTMESVSLLPPSTEPRLLVSI